MNENQSCLSEGDMFYGGIYATFIVTTVLLGGVQAVTFLCAVATSATILHNRMFSLLLRAPIHFFDENPPGTILGHRTIFSDNIASGQ